MCDYSELNLADTSRGKANLDRVLAMLRDPVITQWYARKDTQFTYCQ